ncbi:hypothetical protein HY642_01795 [Candidatus Woesearchaeota archaeon]|nr:hypothetical protein [Candidatus Woesearchaeota archaeon]
MTRFEYDCVGLEGSDVYVSLACELSQLQYQHHSDKRLRFSPDNKLLLEAQDFTTARFLFWKQPSLRKAGVIRFIPGRIMIPAGAVLPVYEIDERSKGLPARGIVRIEGVLACTLEELTAQECLNAGFASKEESLRAIHERYQEFKNDWLITYYYFGNYNGKPTQKELAKVQYM